MWSWVVPAIVCAAVLCAFTWVAWEVWNYEIGE